jgi:hypothetical protein
MSTTGTQKLVKRWHYCRYKDSVEELWEKLISTLVAMILWLFGDSPVGMTRKLKTSKF